VYPHTPRESITNDYRASKDLEQRLLAMVQYSVETLLSESDPEEYSHFSNVMMI
jgi:hypothetical protein